MFLDIDGVLNHESTKARINLPKYPWTCGLDPELLNKYLNWIDDKPIAVVLSSMWRYHDDLLEYLRDHGIDFHDITERGGGFGFLHSTVRGEEVASYLKAHPEITHYAIIDDIRWFLPEQEPFIVFTDPEVGVQEADLAKLDEILELNN